MSILIGKHLDQALAAIRCCCNLSIDWDVLDKIGRDADDDQVNAKDYILHDSRLAQITAHVEEYEPEVVDLKLVRGNCKRFDDIVRDASERAFGLHAYWFPQPFDAAACLADALSAYHLRTQPRNSMGSSRLLAVSELHAIVRCYYPSPNLKPTPYEVLAIDLRTMNVRILHGDEGQPFIIKNYK